LTNSPNEISDSLEPKDEKASLTAELKQAGIKHTPETILQIAKLPDGKIVFLEIGDSRSGLQHILNNHRNQFAEKGIAEIEIPDAVIAALVQGAIVGYQSPNRPIYEIQFKGIIQRIAVTVGSNGYIVCANPRSV